MLTLTAMFMRYGAQGNHRHTVSPHRAVCADATRPRDARHSARAERHLVRGRAGVQRARSSQAVRQLAHHLYAHESLVGGVLDRVCAQWQHAQIIRVKIEAVALDRTIVRVHPDGTGALKNGPHAIGESRGGWTTKLHLVAADARTAITCALSPGQAHDAPEGRTLLPR